MKRLLAFTGALLLCAAGFSQNTTVQWETDVEHKNDSVCTIIFTGTIADGYHTYGTVTSTGYPANIQFSPEDTGYELAGPVYDLGTKTEYKGDKVYFNEIRLAQDIILSGDEAAVSGELNWQSCEENFCAMPEYWEFSIDVRSAVPSGQTVIKDSDTDRGFNWALIIEAILWGFAALLTPCVFPMVPMTVSFFMKGATSPAAGRFRASMYGLFIVLLYTVPISLIILITRIIGGEAVTADIFNWLATHWLPNIVFFIVFMVFAASFFGAFEIVLPSGLVNRSDKGADRGGLIGTFFMALTLVLVSFSCTGPIIGPLLVEAVSLGDLTGPAVGMGAFALALAIPFTLFAIFPSWLKELPKSGGWLNSVKVVLGFVELALSLKFLSVADLAYGWGILDREVFVALWIVIFALLGIYLLGKIRFPHDSKVEKVGVFRFFLAMISLAFSVYLLPGLWGAPLKSVSAFVPPLSTQDFNLYDEGKFVEYHDYDEGMEAAKKLEKPVFLDFSGYGCVNCRKMEAAVIDNSRVRQMIEKEFVMITLMVDDKKELDAPMEVEENGAKVKLRTYGDLWSYLQRYKFGANSQPYYVVLDNEGQLLSGPVFYDENVDNFTSFLQNGLDKYKAE